LTKMTTIYSIVGMWDDNNSPANGYMESAIKAIKKYADARQIAADLPEEIAVEWVAEQLEQIVYFNNLADD